MIQTSPTDSLHVLTQPTDSVMEVVEVTDSAAHATDSVALTADTCAQVPAPSGMQGEPMPYKMESDEAVVGAIALCFVAILVALQRGSHVVVSYLKESFILKKRTSFFDEKVGISAIASTMLCLSTILCSGICVYRHYTTEHYIEHFNHVALLGIYTLAIALLIGGKYLLYNFVNWIFFTREKINSWRQSYWGIIAASGVVLFPTVLYIVFLDSEIQISDYLLLTILLFFKFLLFYKLIGNFFAHLYGVSHLILYFCALEIIPDLLLWKGVDIFNNVFLKL